MPKNSYNWQKSRAMTVEVTIDKFGRILIPKVVREMLSLKAGHQMYLTTNFDKRELIMQVPATNPVQVIERRPSGIPIIHNGEATQADFDVVELIKRNREEYLERKIGMS